MSINQILQESLKQVALESEEEVVAISDDDLDEAIDGFEEDDTGAELVQIDGAIETTANAITGMESLQDAVLECQKNGGMDAQSATLLHAAVESIMAPFGGAAAISKPLPSLESYEGDGGRAAATGYALEGIGEVLKNLWEAFVGMLTKAAAAVKTWFKNLFDKLVKIKKTADSLAKKTSELKGQVKPSETEISYIGSKKFGGKAPEAATIVGLHQDVQKAAKEFGEFTGEALKLVSNADVSSDEKANSFAADYEATVKAFNASITGGGAYEKDSSKSSDKKSVYSMKTKYLGNAVKVLVTVGDEKSIPKFSVETVDVSEKDVKKVKAASKDEVIAIANAISKEASSLSAIKSDAEKYDAQVTKTKAAGDKLVSASRKAEGSTAAARVALKSALHAVSACSNAQRSVMTQMSAAATGMLTNSLTYAGKSYKNLKEAK